MGSPKRWGDGDVPLKKKKKREKEKKTNQRPVPKEGGGRVLARTRDCHRVETRPEFRFVCQGGEGNKRENVGTRDSAGGGTRRAWKWPFYGGPGGAVVGTGWVPTPSC